MSLFSAARGAIQRSQRGADPRSAPHDSEVQRRVGDAPDLASQERALAPQAHTLAVQAKALQLLGEGGGVHQAAAHGISGSSGNLPHLDTIQQSFGRHDVSSVQAHVGGRAAEASSAMGAEAYATGNNVAFASSPSLHTAAHEAAHVVQQRGGVQLKGGVGQVGDVYERHADQVADLVVQGKSAESLLDAYAGGSGGGATSGGPVQRRVLLRSEGLADVDRESLDRWLDRGSIQLRAGSVYDTLVDEWIADDSDHEFQWAYGQRDLLEALEEALPAFRRVLVSRKIALKRPWGNCGRTADLLGRGLVAQGAALNVTTTHYGPGDQATLRGVLEGAVANPTLFDVDLDGVHNFTMEKLADGRQTIQQGYTGGYSAFWWAGLDDGGIYEQPTNQQLIDQRDNYGGGQNMQRDDFTENFETWMGNGYWDRDGQAADYRALPFHPEDSTPRSRERGSHAAMDIKVIRREVTNPVAVYQAFGAQGDEFMTQLVLMHELAPIRAIQNQIEEIDRILGD